MRKLRIPMLHIVYEDEINIKLIEENIKDLAVDPPHGVLETAKSISLYSIKLEKWYSNSIKVVLLAVRPARHLVIRL